MNLWRRWKIYWCEYCGKLCDKDCPYGEGYTKEGWFVEGYWCKEHLDNEGRRLQVNKVQELIEKVARDGNITPEAVEMLCTMTTGEQEIVFMKNPRLTSGVILYLWRRLTGPVLPEEVVLPTSGEEVVTVVIEEPKLRRKS